MVQPVVGNYQLLKKLATGGMAEVWLARQTGIEGFQRHVVVKRILPHLAEDPDFVQMFLNEAKIVSRLSHPNIAQIFDLGETSGQFFIAMEFVHGEDLGRVMRRAWSSGQWMNRHIALRIIADACQALYYAHTRTDEQGRPLRMVHRDISPQNILISFDGAVKLVDFGIAKAGDQSSVTRSGALKGKFAYMSPEQALGLPVDARSDIFSLGLVLYELLTGVRPFKREGEVATLQAAMEGHVDPPSSVVEVPSALDSLVMKALAKNPDDRYPDARAFQKALEEFLVESREMASSVEVSELMATLFADRLEEEARTGAPNPASQSSSSHSQAVAQPTVQPPPVEAESTNADNSLEQTQTEARTPFPRDTPRKSQQASKPAIKKRKMAKRPRVAPPREREDLSQLVDVQSMRTQQRRRFRILIAVLALIGVLGAAFIYSDQLLVALKAKASTEDRVSARITVTTNPPVTVFLVPPPTDVSRGIEEWGRSPILERSGAFVGDTLRFVNEDRGIYFEQLIEYGQPNQLHQFSKEFRAVAVKVRTKPQLRNAEIYRGPFPLGRVGVNFELFPGIHALTIHAEQLSAPFPFTLKVAEEDKNLVWDVDVREAFAPSHQLQ